MFNPNPRRPLTRRQTARIVVAVSILAWATQTLLAQWGFGRQSPDRDPSAGRELLALSQNQATLTEQFFNDPAGTDMSKIFATRLELTCAAEG